MSGYLYFLNNLKEINDKLISYMLFDKLYDKLQNLFPTNGNCFHRKSKLIATPYIL